MRFCMITTFFGAHSFGGDAAYVDRLTRALLRRGHEVEVIYCVDAFETVRGNHPLRPYTPPPGLRIHALRSRLGPLSPLWTHQTGRLGVKLPAIQRVLDDNPFDVIHFHNISLIGGPQVLTLTDRSRHAVKLMTAHEHWLICPLSLLWKLDQKVCDRPQCIRCMIAAGRPPQFWRYTGMLRRALKQIDALIFPSRHTLEIHRQRGIRAPLLYPLPYFLPDDWAAPSGVPPQTVGKSSLGQERPYFAAAGRLVKEKGFQQLIPLMARIPDADLKLAGTGAYEEELRQMAADLPNVHFLGFLDSSALAQLYHGARALVVPSFFYETFGYVAVESFSVGTPALVHHWGALPELISASGGGIAYSTDEELVNAMQFLKSDNEHRRRLGEMGAQAVKTKWSEDTHIERYFELIERTRALR